FGPPAVKPPPPFQVDLPVSKAPPTDGVADASQRVAEPPEVKAAPPGFGPPVVKSPPPMQDVPAMTAPPAEKPPPPFQMESPVAMAPPTESAIFLDRLITDPSASGAELPAVKAAPTMGLAFGPPAVKPPPPFQVDLPVAKAPPTDGIGYLDQTVIDVSLCEAELPAVKAAPRGFGPPAAKPPLPMQDVPAMTAPPAAKPPPPFQREPAPLAVGASFLGQAVVDVSLFAAELPAVKAAPPMGLERPAVKPPPPLQVDLPLAKALPTDSPDVLNHKVVKRPAACAQEAPAIKAPPGLALEVPGQMEFPVAEAPSTDAAAAVWLDQQVLPPQPPFGQEAESVASDNMELGSLESVAEWMAALRQKTEEDGDSVANGLDPPCPTSPDFTAFSLGMDFEPSRLKVLQRGLGSGTSLPQRLPRMDTSGRENQDQVGELNEEESEEECIQLPQQLLQSLMHSDVEGAEAANDAPLDLTQDHSEEVLKAEVERQQEVIQELQRQVARAEEAVHRAGKAGEISWQRAAAPGSRIITELV
ncbi:unnamed protein product, partial [Polarella glacialis]